MKVNLKYIVLMLFAFLIIFPFKSNAATQTNSKPKSESSSKQLNYTYTKIKEKSNFHTSSGAGKKVLFIHDGGWYGIDSTAWNGYSNIAQLMRNEGYQVEQKQFSEINIKDLLPYNVIIFSTNSKSSLNDNEVEALRAFVQQGGGLFLQGEMYIKSNASHYAAVNQIGKPFGVTFDPGILIQESSYETGGGYHTQNNNRDMPIITKMDVSPITQGVTSFRFNWATTIDVKPPAKALAYSQADSWLETNHYWGYNGWVTSKDSLDPAGSHPVLATSSFGRGKLVAIGDSGIFDNGDIGAYSNQKLTLNIINWLADITKEKAHFEPFYPKSNTQYSSVMKGGKVIRYYKILDEKNSPLRKVTFEYKVTGDTQSHTTESDENGLVRIVTPALSKSQDVQVQILSTNYSWVPFPKFHVTVNSRQFSQEWNLALGASGTAGVGLLKASLGPAEFDTVSATLTSTNQTALGITYDVNGSKYDLIMKHALSGDLTLEAKAGLFGGIKDVDLVKVNAGASANAKIREINEVSNKFENFNDQKSKDYNQKLLASAYYTLESAILANPANTSNALLMEVYDILGKKLNLKGERELTKEMQFGLGAGASIDGELNFGAGKAAGTLGSVSIDGVYSLKQAFNEKSKQSAYTMGANFSAAKKALEGSVNIGYKLTKDSANDADANFGIGLDKAVFDESLLYSREFTLEKDKTNKPQKVEIKERYTPTTTDGFLVDGSTSFSNSISLSKTALTELAKKSKQIQTITNGTYRLDLPYNDFYKGVQTLSVKSPWNVQVEQEKNVSASFDIELAAGIDLGFGLNAEGTYQLKYIKQNGVVSSETGFLPTELYSYDSEIKNHEKNVQAMFDEYGKALGNLLNDAVDTVKRKVTDGINNVKDLGASLVDKGHKFVDGAIGAITKLKNTNIFEIRTTNGTTAMIGDIYSVNIMDKNGNPINDFASTPLNLTLNYTDQQLKSRNLTSKEKLISIYMWDGQLGHYTKVPSTVDTIHNHVSASITKNGQYLLAIDNEKPTVTGFSFINSQQNGMKLNASIKDNFSNLEKDNLQLLIDGQVQILSNPSVLFNNYSGEFEFPLASSLIDGKHTATLKVTDADNNILTKTLTFTIDRSLPIISDFQDKERSDKGVDVQAKITDNMMDSAILEVKDIDNTKTLYVAQMLKSSGNIYKATIPANVRIGQDIVYSIMAKDSSGNKISSYQRTKSKIEGPSLALKSTNLINGKADINQTITVKFNQFIQAGTNFDKLTILNEANDSIAAYFTISDDTLFITPASAYEDNKKLKLVIPKEAIVTQSGKTFATDVMINFTTKKLMTEKPIKMEANKIGSKDKVWTIQFNSALRVTSINNGTIFIEDSYGNHIPIIVTLAKDQKTITIRPVNPYNTGNYNLFIQNVSSTKQKTLPVTQVIPFTIK